MPLDNAAAKVFDGSNRSTGTECAEVSHGPTTNRRPRRKLWIWGDKEKGVEGDITISVTMQALLLP